MKIKIRKLSENSVIPAYAKSGDAGMDLTAISKVVVNEKDYGYISYGFGLAIEIPEGFFGLIRPRSSVSKTGLIEATSGIIDSGYRGELSFRYKVVPGSKEYEVGERVAQLLILPYPEIEFEEVNTLSETDRGEGGFGSTNS